MVEGRCHLNQPLQEHLLRLLRAQPHRFPRLMSRKVLPRIIESKAVSKRALGPVEFCLLHVHATTGFKTKGRNTYWGSRPVFVDSTLAEESVVERLRLIPHRRRLKIPRTWLQMLLANLVIERNPQPRSIRNLDEPLLDDWLIESGDQILPPRHVERVILQREEV